MGEIVYDPAMVFRRYGTFTGGIDLPDEKHATLHRAIEPYHPTEPVRVPLAPCGTRAAAPLVAVGAHVVKD